MFSSEKNQNRPLIFLWILENTTYPTSVQQRDISFIDVLPSVEHDLVALVALMNLVAQ